MGGVKRVERGCRHWWEGRCFRWREEMWGRKKRWEVDFCSIVVAVVVGVGVREEWWCL